MRISVVISTYNRLELISRALDSIINQTLPADEIIVVDDGSVDNSASWIKQRYPDLRVLVQPNQGVSTARNNGIRLARNDWIALLDSDDEWLPNKLKQQVAAIEQHPKTVLCHCDEQWVRNGRRVNPMKKHAKAGGWIFEQCLPRCVISPSATMLRKTLLDEVGWFDESLPACEDYDLWLRVCARYPVLYIEQQLLIKYGGHADQLSRLHWGMDRFRITALEKIRDQITVEQRRKLESILKQKINIVLNGAIKRSNQSIISDCRSHLQSIGT